MGEFRGDGMAGRPSVDPDGGARFDELGDGAGDRRLLGYAGRGSGAVGGGAADDRPAVDPLKLSRLVQLGEVSADGHAGHAETFRQLGDVDLTGLLQRFEYVALTSGPCVLCAVDL